MGKKRRPLKGPLKSAPSEGSVPLEVFAAHHPDLMRELEHYNPLSIATAFAGLLTKPDLQSNCLRLEVLAHLGVSQGGGDEPLPPDVAAKWFKELGTGPCGEIEGPAESVFVSLIETPRGNFRVLEGLWEKNAFYLQRLLNVLEYMGDDEFFSRLLDEAHALLALSERVCDRAGLTRHRLGNQEPQEEIALPIVSTLPELQKVVTFGPEDLASAAIKLDDLAPFVFDPDERGNLIDEALLNSSLERFPIGLDHHVVHLLLPTAVSAAIRRYVIEQVRAAGMIDALARDLAAEFALEVSSSTLFLGNVRNRLGFVRHAEGLFAGMMYEVDRGRYLNLLLFSDLLDDFDATGLAGYQPGEEQLTAGVEKLIRSGCKFGTSRAGFRQGLCLVVGCGIGRGARLVLRGDLPAGWRVVFVDAGDLLTLGDTEDFDVLSIFRVLDAKDRLAALGVELQVPNGLLNLVAWILASDGHLIPNSALPADFLKPGHTGVVRLPPNALRDHRHQVASLFDCHRAQDVDGSWVQVMREGRSYFEADDHRPLFTAYPVPGRNPASVYETSTRAWWCEVVTPEGASVAATVSYLRMAAGWISRMAPVLEAEFPDIPMGSLLWRSTFESVMEEKSGDFEVADPSILHGAMRLAVIGRVVELHVSDAFEAALFHPENIAERELVRQAMNGFARMGGADPNGVDDGVLSRVIPDHKARYCHAFRAKRFLEMVRESLPRQVTFIDHIESNAVKLGAAWAYKERRSALEVSGTEECVALLNGIVRDLQARLCESVGVFNRRALLRKCLEIYDTAAVENAYWNSMASALLSLHSGGQETLETMAWRQGRFNAIFVSARLVIEAAMASSPIEGGAIPGTLDLVRLMAMARLPMSLGGWSDAIRWKALKPFVRITALGDIHVERDFFEGVVDQFGRTLSDDRVSRAAKSYPTRFDPSPSVPEVESLLDQRFVSAWQDEFGFSIDQLRQFRDFVEDLGIDRKAAIFELPRSQLIRLAEEAHSPLKGVAEGIVNAFTFPIRNGWADIPAGYDQKDADPWRFRRRLSVLRRPLIPLSQVLDPTLLVAPGRFGQAVSYMLRCYHDGEFPARQLRSQAMMSWQGASQHHRGNAFTQAVGRRMTELGWKVEIDIKITKLLGQSFERNYGDVDVLAWRPGSSRLLLIECKDVQFHKTDGEIAEQLSDFLGEIRPDGKPDFLRKHLDRFALARQHVEKLVRFTGSVPSIEAHLVFRNPVPMAYAWEKMKERVAIALFDDLDRL